MRHVRWMAVIVGVCYLAAMGDVLYLRDGRKYEGTITRDGDRVKISLVYPAGTVLEFDAADVAAATTAPIASRPVTVAPEDTTPVQPKDRPFSVDRASCPEPVAYLYMRNLLASMEGDSKAGFRRQVEAWQAAAKDRKRQISPGMWITPADFATRKKSALAQFKEAADVIAKVLKAGNTHVYSTGGVNANLAAATQAAHLKEEKKKADMICYTRQKQGAQLYPDPILRDFYTGQAELDANNFGPARLLFRMTVVEAARIPTFHQALGMAYMGEKRYREAMESFITMLQLLPDSRDAVQLAREALKKVPGSELGHSSFVNAKKILSAYAEEAAPPSVTYSSYSTVQKKINWVLPDGKTLAAPEGLVPVLPWDRFVFRQGLAVPVSETSLLVDSQIVKDALAVYVQIDSNNIVPAKLKRGYSTFGSGSKTLPLPLELITVPGYTFTSISPPLPAVGFTSSKDKDKKEAPKYTVGQQFKLHGIGSLEEMTCRVRISKPTVKEVAEGGVVLSEWLAPGEGAGPVFSAEGQLAGVVAGKTDALAENGGPDRFYTIAELMPLLKNANQKGFSSSYSGGAKRVITPQAAAGQYFVIYATVGEKLE